jgi:HD-like signal output (HDOD) protein
MPIFGHTVQSVVTVAENERAPAAELVKVVLQDASMTARVLKLVNTIYYNPREQSISTISRAVVVLGFNTVLNLCLSISLVDSFVHGKARDRLTSELARSIHASVQARTIAMERGDASPEEVFIATLLFHLGELGFWCFAGEAGEQLDSVMDQPGYTPEQAQDEVLGFRLRQLTMSLAEEWRLNPLLSSTLADPAGSDVREKNVLLAHRLAASAEEHGWNAPETKAAVQKVAKLTGRSEKEVTLLVHQNAREAARIAILFGAGSAAKAIPIPAQYAQEAAQVEAEAAQAVVPAYPEPDGLLQLKILRELSMLLDKVTDFNLIMELVLEGMYRGVGMDRTLFALLTPDRRGVRAKYALGDRGKDFVARFQFAKTQAGNILFEALETQKCYWVDVKGRPEYAPLVPPNLTGVVGKVPFYVCPIVVNGRAIGVFYADRALSGRPLDEDSYESFKHFAKQANLGLSMIAGRSRR